ncbi:alpha/beta-hydrolase [Auriculariales sp. MPI-PUGE-AT-0066]|nr:alpha/beta-hydrolase [Auriculariales sp. MPI-PUGE-AT-0066]
MSSCEHCVTTVKHEGTPTDAFGAHYINNQLLADAYAENGYHVFVPDLFNGHPLTDTMLADPKAQTRPVIDTILTTLRTRGITSFGVVGYCFGGRYSWDLALDGVEGVKVLALSHPSLLKIPEDIEAFKQRSRVPLLLNVCDVDHQYGPEAQKIGDELLGNGTYTPGYKRTFWPGCEHGFAVRGNLSKPEVVAGKEGAFKASVEWLRQYL